MKVVKRMLFFVLVIFIAIACYIGFTIRGNVKKVTSYKTQVEAATEEYGITEYQTLVYAIIYTESKGKSVDLMQSSESAYGQQAMIETTEESIQVGVSFLAQAISKAEESGCDIWTAVQAYNFGLEYISFVKERGGKNSIALAEEYSKEFLSPLLGNDTGKTYRYYRWQSILYNGGYLYSNGGNMFYAELVKMNRDFVKWFS